MAVSIIRVQSDDGPYDTFFSVPSTLDPEDAQQIVNARVGDLYSDEDAESPFDDMVEFLSTLGIELVNLYDIENRY